ncbi:MAG: hypothetical protein DRN99_05065 [Thermoproteota archaeon]|nr:MAG: hypothetical protein DRN99_05065 [Candidatus Korarchaeota archaeon]
MKIGMMTLWNAANGPSVHAELVGREWVRMGHRLVVFSAIRHPDARPTMQKDESYVVRHFAVDEVVPVTKASFFDPRPLLDEDYEVFVAQNVERLPTRELLEVFPEIRGKAVTVMVVHEGGPPADPLYYKFEWDGIVCFDERYVEFISRFFPREVIHVIPYPCHPLKLGDKVEARRRLGLPLDRRIVFSYGFRVDEVAAVLPALEELSREVPLMYLVVANPGGDVERVKRAVSGYGFVELRVSALPLNLLYDYLHAADALLIYRESSRKYRAVLSSSVCLTIGSGCPILYHESNFVEKHGDEIVKYRDLDDLKRKLKEVFEGRFSLERVMKFLRERSADVIASRFIRLFEELLEGRRLE